MSANALENYLPEEFVLGVLKMKRKTLRNYVSVGRDHPPVKRIGRAYLFPKKEFNEWLSKKDLIKPLRG
jgi:hypothetical protein